MTHRASTRRHRSPWIFSIVLLTVTAISAPAQVLDLQWSTYFGGDDTERGRRIAMDGAGNIYGTGWTQSANMPAVGGMDGNLSGSDDAFVVSFTADGQLAWSTYLGGDDFDSGYGIDVDSAGNVYLAGSTLSTDFPAFGSYDSSYNGPGGSSGVGGDAYVTKLGPGGGIRWSTYLGGSEKDRANRVVVDSAGNVYVTGDTRSDDFPTSGGYDVSFNGGGRDVFVTKLGANGGLRWSTFLGGTGDETSACRLAVDRAENVYETGKTFSADFPTPSGYDTDYNGGGDVFLAKINENGALIWSTYLGGVGEDHPAEITADAAGNVYVTGWTTSADFPTTAGYDTSHNGDRDAFVAKFSADGAMLQSFFLAGSGQDRAQAIAVAGAGSVYVSGYTYSSDFPSVGGYQPALSAAGPDAFLAKFTEQGALVWSTYLGGTNTEGGVQIGLGIGGDIFLKGWTQSGDFPTLAAYDDTYNGAEDVFVAKFREIQSAVRGNWRLYGRLDSNEPLTGHQALDR